MGASYNSGVVLGYKPSDLGFDAKLITTNFEIHDKKGNPTGKFDCEYSWEITYKGKEYIKEGAEFYAEWIDNIMGLEFWLNEADRIKNPVELFNINHYDDFSLDNVIIGIKVIERDYNDYNILKEINLNEIQQVNVPYLKNEILKQGLVETDGTIFGFAKHPSLYYYFQIS